MKIQISFELDARDTIFNIRDENDISVTISNISMLLSQLRVNILMKQIELHTSDLTDCMKKSALKMYNNEVKLLESMFSNFRVAGVMENGKAFTFNHSEPGYNETLLIDDMKA